MRYCTKCGIEVSVDSKFCRECGNLLNENSGIENRALVNKLKGKTFIFASIGAVVILAVLVIALFLTGVFDGKDDAWCLEFQGEGKEETEISLEELVKYDAWYMGDTDDKVIYLTFDCEYENGNTEIILDALKKHNAKVTFFVAGSYLENNQNLVKCMVEEGHIVGNHSYHHRDMLQMSKEEFVKELEELETLYERTIGTPMMKYFRPPQGKYSKSSLQYSKDLGYKTIFYSLDYMNGDEENQPTHEEAF